jgi:hypothetical protein
MESFIPGRIAGLSGSFRNYARFLESRVNGRAAFTYELSKGFSGSFSCLENRQHPCHPFSQILL